MISRREFMQAVTAAAMIYGGSSQWSRLAAIFTIPLIEYSSLFPFGAVVVMRSERPDQLTFSLDFLLNTSPLSSSHLNSNSPLSTAFILN